jgi:TolA-binding protein
LGLLKAAQREGTSFFETGINAQIRWWLGNLLVEMGRPREAEPYFRSLTGGIRAQPRGFGGGFWQGPLAAYYLGQVNEELGEIDRARRSYQFFIEGWQDADPELQPMVQEARAAIQRLSSVVRE